MSMFCNQCEQTAKGTGCTVAGVCGKQPTTAGLQDLLLHQLKGIGFLAHTLRQKGIIDEAADLFTIEGLFTTVTNVNFDDSRIVVLIGKAVQVRDSLVAKLTTADSSAAASLPESATFSPETTVDGLAAQAAARQVRAGT